MITRLLEKTIQNKIGKGKVIIILGARQTGKTTLLKEILSTKTKQPLFLNADKPLVQKQLETCSVEDYKQLFGDSKLIFIDEAQRIKNIGIVLKLMVDEMPDIQIIATGSSAFELANTINEPLTGRKFEYKLYPLSWAELVNHTNFIDALSQLNQRIVYGMYPEVITNTGNEKEILLSLSESYLYKDIIAFQEIRKPEFVQKLLQALAFQIGSEVSYNELSNMLQIDRKTIIHYIDLLEKAYIIFRLPSFSRNLRKELTSKIKIFFYDTGIRNALIEDFKPVNLRNDIGALWENFVIAERIKSNHYSFNYCKNYFWRTHQKQEIDYVEESDGTLKAFEIKWNPNAKAKIPKTFTDTYPDSELFVITPDNFTKIIL